MSKTDEMSIHRSCILLNKHKFKKKRGVVKDVAYTRNLVQRMHREKMPLHSGKPHQDDVLSTFGCEPSL